MEHYYTEEEVLGKVDDMEALTEYLHGWDDAMTDSKYKKIYVDMFCDR